MNPSRKAIPYGAVASAAAAPFMAATSVGVHDLRAQERACGMVSSWRQASAVEPPVGIVKAQTADCQCNQIAQGGGVAVLTKAPRARWRKVSRAKMLLVEDDRTPFSDPEKSLQPRLQHHGSYVRRLGALPTGMPVLRFVLYNDGYSHGDILHRFAYEVGVPPEAVELCTNQPGGFFGCTTQFGACVGVTREQIAHVSRHYNLHPLLFDPREYCPVDEFARFASSPPTARLHRVVVRHTSGTEADVRRALQSLMTSGFANFYGLEHFGCGEGTLFDMARFAARGEYLRAAGCYLQMLADTDPLHHARYTAYLSAEPDTTAGVAQQWALQCRAARVRPVVTQVIDALAAYQREPRVTGAAEAVWRTVPVREEADRAAAKMVWNAMASQRLLLSAGDGASGVSRASPALVGDVVERADGSHGVLTSASEAAHFTLADVVLPVPFAGTLASPDTLLPSIGGFDRGLFEAFATQHGFPFLLAERVVETGCTYRHVLEAPQRLQASVVHDPNSLFALKTDLFLTQEHKQPGTLTFDFEQRARQPCVYNVSERFAERMQGLKGIDGCGTQSVALSFVLRGDASPTVALRDVFRLRYATVHDLHPL